MYFYIFEDTFCAHYTISRSRNRSDFTKFLNVIKYLGEISPDIVDFECFIDSYDFLLTDI